MTITKLFLRPKITFIAYNITDKTIINEMYHRERTECFIVNAVLTEILIEQVF
ncbi:MAG: hypothetical protein ACI976_002210 [Aureispira sp.]|jgi:hypothetical protein